MDTKLRFCCFTYTDININFHIQLQLNKSNGIKLMQRTYYGPFAQSGVGLPIVYYIEKYIEHHVCLSLNNVDFTVSSVSIPLISSPPPPTKTLHFSLLLMLNLLHTHTHFFLS